MAAAVIRWHDQRRSTGEMPTSGQAGTHAVARIEAHRRTILALHGAHRDITLDELRRELGQAGRTVVILKLHRFFARHGIAPGKFRSRVTAFYLGAYLNIRQFRLKP